MYVRFTARAGNSICMEPHMRRSTAFDPENAIKEALANAGIVPKCVVRIARLAELDRLISRTLRQERPHLKWTRCCGRGAEEKS